MAIQNRRGDYQDFDPSRMLPGEWAVVQSGNPDVAEGEAVYMALRAGKVKRMATFEDIQTDLSETADGLVDAATERAENAANSAAESAGAARTSEENALSHEQHAAASIETITEKTDEVRELRDETRAYRDQAAGYAGAAVFSIGQSPDTGGLALYYNDPASS